MFLLNPLALGFLVLAPLIVALYLLKLRRQPARVSTLMFWQRVTADTRRRALFQRLRQVLSLLLHLLIFALLIFALARPEWHGFRGAEGGQSTVVVLDARARMQTRLAGGGSRFAAARGVAESYLRRAAAGRPVALLTNDGAARVVVGLTDEEKTLLAGLGSVQATDAGGRIEDALALAGELLAGRAGSKRIVVVTDRAVELPPGVRAGDVETRIVGEGETPRENVGITRLAARTLPASPETGEVFVEIENFGAGQRAGNVELSFEGGLVDVKPFDLAPGERRAEVYPALAVRSGVANARGWLTARLAFTDQAGDALDIDNAAFAVVPPPRPIRVLLVSAGNWFLESLLRADNQVSYEQLAPDAFQPAQAAGFDVTILDDVLPAAFGQQLSVLPPGNFLFLGRAPLPSSAGGGAAELARPPLTDLDAGSPLLRLVNLRDVTVLRAQDWALPEGDAAGGWRLGAPVRSLEHPLVVTGERGALGRGGQRLVALAFGAADSDLPLRVAFPLFVRDTLGWLAGRDAAEGSAGEAGIRAGDAVTLAEGETVWTKPQREYLPVNTVPEAEKAVGPGVFVPERNGFYLRRGADGAERWLAVNTGEREMSTVNAARAAAQTPATSQGNILPDAAGGWRTAAGTWPPWVYCALLAFALCALEWWGFHRRRTE